MTFFGALLISTVLLIAINGNPLYLSKQYRLRIKRYFHPSSNYGNYYNGHHGEMYNRNYGANAFGNDPDSFTEIRAFEVPPSKPQPQRYAYGRPMAGYPGHYPGSRYYGGASNSFGGSYKDDYGGSRMPGFPGDFRGADSNGGYFNEPNDLQEAIRTVDSIDSAETSPMNLRNNFMPWGQGLGEYLSGMKRVA